MAIDPLYSRPVTAERVLCPPLYQKLKNIFTNVVVSKRGERFYKTSSISPVTGFPQDTIISSGEYYCVDCPFCRDTRKRLWVNHMFGQPDAYGRPMYHLAVCYNEHCLEESDKRIQFREMLFGFKNARDRAAVSPFAVLAPSWDEPAVSVVPEMPDGLIPLTRLAGIHPSHPAVDYMYNERGYTSDILDRYGVSYCSNSVKFKQASNRIIFPYIFKGRLIGWQGRYIGKANWKQVSKYYGMPNMQKRLALYNYDIANSWPFVVLTEGVTHVHRIGDPAIAFWGKDCSPVQLELLINTWGGKPFIVLLDPDAYEPERPGQIPKAIELINNLTAARQIVIPIRLPNDYDAADYPAKEIQTIIITTAARSGIVIPPWG